MAVLISQEIMNMLPTDLFHWARLLTETFGLGLLVILLCEKLKNSEDFCEQTDNGDHQQEDKVKANFRCN